MKRKKLPIGLSDFRTLIGENYYYIDKTLFIKELVDSGARVTILPRPRRFGKTLNLNMLKCFFERKEEGEINLFEKLAIWQTGEEYREHYGQYPVIYLTFKDVKSSSWKECLKDFENLIRNLYISYAHLLEEKGLNAIEKEQFSAIMSLKDEGDYKNSLALITRCLHKVYKSKVVILIDEYDIPIQQGYTEDFYKEVVEFTKTFLSGGLKDNPYLELAVLTGILRVSKESIFSDLNNPKVCTLLSDKYSDKFGLLEEEVTTLLEYFGIESEIEHVRNWYNGYLCGQTELYNPWSIINYVDSWKEGFKPYWINSSSNTLIKQILTRGGETLKYDLKRLIEDRLITKIIDENIVFPEIEADNNHLFSFLLFSGYLKPVKIIHKERKIFCDLAIPNEEVKALYEKIITSWFSETIRNERMELMLKSLTSGDIDTFAEIFTYYVEQSFSYYNLGNDDAERVYQAFSLGLVLWLSKDYAITSEDPGGFGRADIMLIPHDKSRTGIIIEFKKASKVKKQSLEEAAQAAKDQILTRNYKAKMEAHGVKRIIQLAIGFKGKECLIREV